MDNFLLGFGYVLLAAAIVGGGLSASGVSLPVVSSLWRQFLLGLLGLFLVVTGHDERGLERIAEQPPAPAPAAAAAPEFQPMPDNK